MSDPPAQQNTVKIDRRSKSLQISSLGLVEPTCERYGTCGQGVSDYPQLLTFAERPLFAYFRLGPPFLGAPARWNASPAPAGFKNGLLRVAIPSTCSTRSSRVLVATGRVRILVGVPALAGSGPAEAGTPTNAVGPRSLLPPLEPCPCAEWSRRTSTSSACQTIVYCRYGSTGSFEPSQERHRAFRRNCDSGTLVEPATQFARRLTVLGRSPCGLAGESRPSVNQRPSRSSEAFLTTPRPLRATCSWSGRVVFLTHRSGRFHRGFGGCIIRRMVFGTVAVVPDVAESRVAGMSGRLGFGVLDASVVQTVVRERIGTSRFIHGKAKMSSSLNPGATLFENGQVEPQDKDTEAYQTLIARVGRKSPTIPASVLVRHVMALVPANEWPARVEAIDAVLRRLEVMKRDGLRISARPEDNRFLGAYATKRAGSTVRPYSTLLSKVDPVEGRCDCPDYVRNSLGLCKHILVILERIHTKPRVLQQALKEQEKLRGSTAARLRWDPIRPLTGTGDWLDRVVIHATGNKPKTERWAQAERWFKSGKNGTLVLAKSFLTDPSKRLTLVEDLLKVVPQANNGIAQDPALRALLSAERDRLNRIVKQALTSSELRAALKGLKQPLYPYQREGVERFLSLGRLLLADDMGLGKTAQAIAICDILWRTERIRKGLIIAPASLKPQWAREWAVFSELPIAVIDGGPGERQAIYESTKAGLFIINYEQLLKDLAIIRRWNPDLVVLDEAQRIKNWATKTALSVKGLAPPYRLVLTGTPMENRIEELASIVEWVDDMALEPKWRLNPIHTIRSDGKKDVIGVRHLETLRERLRGCMVRRIRQEVLDQLPPRTDTRVPVEMTEAQTEEHDALIQPIVALIQRSKKRPLTQAEFLKLMSMLATQRIISNGLAQLRFEEVWPVINTRTPEESVIRSLSTPKLLELRQLIRQLVLDQGRKIVIFSQWRRMLTLAHWSVSDLLGEAQLRGAFFTGHESQKRRTQNIVEFHDDPDHRLLFATDAGGVGLNLQRASNCVINLELPWNPAVLEQRIGRVYRLGQKYPIDVFNLVSETGIESRIASLVGSKQAFFKGLFDSDSDVVQFDQAASFMSRIEKLHDPALLATAAVDSGTDELELPDLGDSDLDDEISDPFEPLVDAGDESEDATSAVAAESVHETTVAAGPRSSPQPTGSVEEDDTPSPAPPPSAAIGDIRQLFSQLQIRRSGDGKVLIEAPEEAASTLSALFEGMATLLQSLSKPPGPEGSNGEVL
jgi:hypothetical protein